MTAKGDRKSGRLSALAWTQFRLRTLLLVVVVLAVPLSWLAEEIATERRELKILRFVEESGGAVVYLQGVPSGWKPDTSKSEIPAETGIRWLVSRSLDAHGVAIDLQGCRAVNRNLLGELGSIRRLCSLSLRKTPITDDDLNIVKDLRSLEVLDLEGTNATGAGISRLESMSRLKVLVLHDCQNVAAYDVEQIRRKLPSCDIVFP